MATEEPATWEPAADDDWFGEGTAFKTEEELAAALFALAGTLGLDGAPHPQEPSPFRLDDETVPVVAVEHPPLLPRSRNGNGHGPAARPTASDEPPEFEVIDAFEPSPESSSPKPAKPPVTPSRAPQAWGVRPPGAELLPPRQPGRTGWSIRNSVKLLNQIDLTMQRLREDAVVAAFNAAARALHNLPEGYSAGAAADPARSVSRRRISM